MTALRPVDSRNVKAVAAEEYPSNTICAHPECKNKVDLRPDGTPTVHHAFSRSKIKSSSYFVSIDEGKPIPHAVGFCGSGTTGHHGDLEDQRAKLVLEDGVWSWWDGDTTGPDARDSGHTVWRELGALSPQPGSRESKPKRRKFAGEAKRKRVNWQIRVPKDAEDGAGLLDELIVLCAEKCTELGMPYDEDTPPYYVLTAALSNWLQ